MSLTWFCKTCEERISEEEVDEHEAEGHRVKGVLVPDRLLANDPWQMSAAGNQINNN